MVRILGDKRLHESTNGRLEIRQVNLHFCPCSSKPCLRAFKQNEMKQRAKPQIGARTEIDFDVVDLRNYMFAWVAGLAVLQLQEPITQSVNQMLPI